MSRAHEAMYELERKQREELERKRAAEFSEKNLKELTLRYEKMKEENYDRYVPNEMEELSQRIKHIEQLLLTDVIEARRICYQAQNLLSSMDILVRSAKEEFARQERLRYEQIQRQKEEAKTKLEEFFYTQLRKIQNPTIANFAVKDIESLRVKIKNEEILQEEEVLQKLQEISKLADEKFETWKQNKLAEKKIERISSQIDEAIKGIENEKFENSDNKSRLIEEMNLLKTSISSESSENEVIEKLNAIRSSVDNSLIDEEVRRGMVKAIIGELQSQEFSVEKPKIFGSGKDSYVLVRAKKPSGKQVTCKINLEGKLNYKFDQYEGMTCLTDIEKFSVDLEKIYSVKLSDERIIWENPDRLSRTQSVASNSNRRNM